MREVATREGAIRLGQFLKLADVVAAGSDAKMLLAEGAVTRQRRARDAPRPATRQGRRRDRRRRAARRLTVRAVDWRPARRRPRTIAAVDNIAFVKGHGTRNDFVLLPDA